MWLEDHSQHPNIKKEKQTINYNSNELKIIKQERKKNMKKNQKKEIEILSQKYKTQDLNLDFIQKGEQPRPSTKHFIIVVWIVIHKLIWVFLKNMGFMHQNGFHNKYIITSVQMLLSIKQSYGARLNIAWQHKELYNKHINYKYISTMR